MKSARRKKLDTDQYLVEQFLNQNCTHAPVWANGTDTEVPNADDAIEMLFRLSKIKSQPQFAGVVDAFITTGVMKEMCVKQNSTSVEYEIAFSRGMMRFSWDTSMVPQELPQPQEPEKKEKAAPKSKPQVVKKQRRQTKKPAPISLPAPTNYKTSDFPKPDHVLFPLTPAKYPAVPADMEGFTPEQIKMYDFIVEYGPVSVDQIATVTRFHQSVVMEAIRSFTTPYFKKVLPLHYVEFDSLGFTDAIREIPDDADVPTVTGQWRDSYRPLLEVELKALELLDGEFLNRGTLMSMLGMNDKQVGRLIEGLTWSGLIEVSSSQKGYLDRYTKIKDPVYFHKVKKVMDTDKAGERKVVRVRPLIEIQAEEVIVAALADGSRKTENELYTLCTEVAVPPVTTEKVSAILHDLIEQKKIATTKTKKTTVYHLTENS